MPQTCRDITPSQDEPSPPVQRFTPDQRRWTRLAVEEGREVVDLILADGESWPAIVDDFSFTGAKLTVLCGDALSKGDPLEVVYSGAPMKATVTWIKGTDDTAWAIGIEWKKRKK